MNSIIKKSKKLRFGAFALAVLSMTSLFSFSTVSAQSTAVVNTPVISGGYLRGIEENTLGKDIKSVYSTSSHGCSYNLFDKNEEFINSNNNTHIISTGDFIRDSNLKTYTVVVCGDLNGDGKVTITDSAAIKMHLSDTITLTDAVFEAADVDFNNKISATDYLRVKFHIQKIYNIYDKESHIPDVDTESDDSKFTEDDWTSGWI